MISQEQNLSAEQQAGLGGEELLAAVAGAERVNAEAAVAMSDQAHTQSAASDAFGAMAGCREMFDRFMSALSPTETDKAPAATTATGGCKKEA